MKRIPFKQVDVFSSVPFQGNPVAVVLEARTLSTSQMQQIANWTNLSETAFVLPPTIQNADYQARIFTPTAEVPFAGHPTIGTAHALIEAGVINARSEDVLVQQCAAGLVRLQVSYDGAGRRWIAFDMPTPKLSPLSAAEVEEIEAALGVALVKDRSSPMLVDVGIKWVVGEGADATAVLSATPILST